MAKKKYKYVNDLWKDSEVKKLDPANRLIYRSNKLGSDQRITNTGGGNTSSKLWRPIRSRVKRSKYSGLRDPAAICVHPRRRILPRCIKRN